MISRVHTDHSHQLPQTNQPLRGRLANDIPGTCAAGTDRVPAEACTEANTAMLPLAQRLTQPCYP